ncbi:hypothetical protein CBL_04271 [Carabus blaptoides fortunei]
MRITRDPEIKVECRYNAIIINFDGIIKSGTVFNTMASMTRGRPLSSGVVCLRMQRDANYRNYAKHRSTLAPSITISAGLTHYTLNYRGTEDKIKKRSHAVERESNYVRRHEDTTNG